MTYILSDVVNGKIIESKNIEEIKKYFNEVKNFWRTDLQYDGTKKSEAIKMELEAINLFKTSLSVGSYRLMHWNKLYVTNE